MMSNKMKHPLIKSMEKTLIKLPTPTSISYLWNWGSMLGLCLLIQMMTGIMLSSHYNSSTTQAFNSISKIMRDVSFGWEMRFIHMNTASFFFVCLFIHISRGLYMSSFKNATTWITGVLIIFILMATAFVGYVLPWGQMSFWGATVITNLLSAIPSVGKKLVEWLWGGFSINTETLNRFFSMHFMMPFMLVAFLGMHLMSLHSKGSNKPTGLKQNTDKIKFHPYFVIKDSPTALMLMATMIMLTMNQPTMMSDPENFNLANPMLTPVHIQPEWYFLFAYAILRSIPNKLGGVMALSMSIAMLMLMPAKSKNKFSKKWMPNMKYLCWVYFFSFMNLSWLGAMPVENPFEETSKIFSVLYFMSMLMMCFYYIVLKTKKVYNLKSFKK